MLSKKEIEQILLEACKTGADFAELYLEDTKDATIRMTKDKVDSMTNSSLLWCWSKTIKRNR